MQPIPKHYRVRRRLQQIVELGPVGAARWIRHGVRSAGSGGSLPFPPTVAVEPTDHCNLACPSCPQPRMSGEKGYMTTALLRKVVDECSRQPSFTSLVFTGYGEPLLHPDLCEMSAFAKEKGVPIVRTYTNATILDDRRIEALLRSDFDEITLSLNGPTLESYERIKGGDDFERVAGNIRQFLLRKRELRRTKPFVNLHLLELTDANYDWNGFVLEWEPLLGPGDCLVLKPSHSFAGQVGEPGYGVLEDGDARRPCGQLWSYLHVARAGEVSPCCVDPFKRLVIGDANDSDLKELWQSARLRRLRGCHKAGQYDRMPLCQSCQTWRYFTTDRGGLVQRMRRLWG